MNRDLRRYLEQSRTLPVGLVAVLPLLAIYELGILLSGSPAENYAGLLVKRMIGAFGFDVYLLLTALVASAFLLALAAKRRGPARRFHDYWLMMFESLVYAAVLGPLVLLVMGGLTPLAAGGEAGAALRALLYTGAGVWEELVFRLALLGGFRWLAVDRARASPVVFGLLGVLISAAAFAGFHHLGAGGEPFTPRVFLFRFVAGALLGALYLLRGLGICVYTHAFYNVGLLAFGPS